MLGSGAEQDLISGKELWMNFGSTRSDEDTWALRGVNVSIPAGKSLGLAGQSGSGKTTLARILAGLLVPTRGVRIWQGGVVGMIFQDAVGSLDPRSTVGSVLREPLELILGLDETEMAVEVERLLDSVGLGLDLLERFPHELSGGQAQRVALARALAGKPSLLIADEPVSALDVSIQAQVLNLLQDLRQAMGFTLLLVTHDLSLLPLLCDRTLVLKDGRIVEEGATEKVLANPQDPYAKALVAASRL